MAHWGVDSAEYVDHLVPLGSSSPSLFDYIMHKTNGVPEFWGRYIGGPYPLEQHEIDFLIAKKRDLHLANLKILVTYDGANNLPVGDPRDPLHLTVQGGYDYGMRNASRAISAAQALNVPTGVWIYADIEAGWLPTEAWFRGWSDVMHDSAYTGGAGGVYCNTADLQHFVPPYCMAYQNDDKMRDPNFPQYLWTTQPQRGCTSAAGAPAFAPTQLQPPCNQLTVIWQYQIRCYGTPSGGHMVNQVDEDLADDTGFATMWAL